MKQEYVRLSFKSRVLQTWHRVSANSRRVECGFRIEAHTVAAVTVAETPPEPFCSNCEHATRPVDLRESTVLVA